MDLDAEIFAVGKWNGGVFDAADLEQIASTFAQLGDNMRVPLKFGHNDEQQMTDGHPALGWVSKLWVAGDKLMAKFTDLPKIVHDAITKKMYKNVSIELDIDVQYKGSNIPYVLSGVALLGADIPAVNTLKDLTHYLSRGDFVAGRRAVFSAIAGQQTDGGNNMELEKLTAQIAELTASVTALTTENAGLKATVSKFEAASKEAEAVEAKAKLTAKRAEINAILEEGVKSEAITPAAREQFSKLMRVEDDVAVLSIDVEEVKKLTANGKKQFSKEQGRQNGDGNDELRVDQVVANEISAVLAKKEAIDFTSAQSLVFSRNPKLAREYANFNDKE